MRNCFCILYFTCLLAIPSYGQYWGPVTPSEVLLSNKTIAIEPVYFLGENHYTFISNYRIDSIQITSINNFTLKKEGENKYSISRVASDKTKLIHPSSIYLTIFQAKKKPIKITVEVALFPPVKIIFCSYMQELDPEKTIQVVNAFYAKAEWDYPSYVKGGYRFRGTFIIDLFADGIQIQSLYGWYDTSDQTRPFSLSSLKNVKKLEAILNESKISTLNYGYFVEQKAWEPLKLSNTSHRKITFQLLPE